MRRTTALVVPGLVVLGLAVCGASQAYSDDRSLSLGNASDGRLVNGKRLDPIGKHHRVIESTRRRGYHWGTDELVGLILRSAARVAKAYPGAVLQVGNMSKRGGGDIPVSASHNSGRDVDLPFYVLDAKGKPVREHGFVKFEGGLVSGSLRFDVPRNWTLVKALLEDTAVQVHWIFVADPLREALLAHAKRKRETEALTERAAQVLGQPANSSEHAEHFHVRLYCARHERLEGCLNYGPMWTWVDDFAKELAAASTALAASFLAADVAKAVAAIQKVRVIRGTGVISALVTVLGDTRRVLRVAASEALAVLDGAVEATPALARAALSANDAEEKARHVATLGAVGDARASDALLAVLADRRVASPETRVEAARSLGRLQLPASVPGLVAALDDPAAPVRVASEEALDHVTGPRFGATPAGRRAWATFVSEHAGQPRSTWLRRGFASRFRIDADKQPLRSVVTRLVALVRRGGAVGRNARGLIGELTGHVVEQAHFTAFQLWRFYRSWLLGGGLKAVKSAP